MRASSSGFDRRVLQVVQRRQRLHQRHQVVRPELVDELRQRVAQRQCDLRPLVDVIVVQEDRKQPHVLARGFEHRVLLRADLQRLVEIRRARAVDLDELQRLDRLRHVVVGDLEVFHLEIGDGLVAALRHGDVHAHEIGARAEDRLLWRRFAGAGFCSWAASAGSQQQNEDKPHTRILY